nr:hypothetical protein [Bacilli bacterium]
MHKEEGSTLLTVLFIMLITSIMLVSMYSATFTNTSTVNATISHSQALMNARSGLEMTYQDLNKAWNTTWNGVTTTISQGGSIALTTAEATLSQFVTTETAQLTTANSAFTVSVTSGANDLTSATESTGLYQDFNVSVTGISGQNTAVLNDTFVISGTIPALNYVAYTPGNLVIAGSPSLQGDVYVGNSLYLDTHPWLGIVKNDSNPSNTVSYVQPLDPSYAVDPYSLQNSLQSYYLPSMITNFEREPLSDLANGKVNLPTIIGSLSVHNAIAIFNGVTKSKYFGDAGDPNFLNNANQLLYNGSNPNVIWNSTLTRTPSSLSSSVNGNPTWLNFTSSTTTTISSLVNAAFQSESSLQKASFYYDSRSGYYIEYASSVNANTAIDLSSQLSSAENTIFSLAENDRLTQVEFDPYNNILWLPKGGLQQPLYVQGDLVVPSYIDQNDSVTNIVNDGQPIYITGNFLMRGDMEPDASGNQGTIYVDGESTLANIPAGNISRLEVLSLGNITAFTLSTIMGSSPFTLHAYLVSNSNIFISGMIANLVIDGGLSAQNIILSSTLGNQFSSKGGLIQWTDGNYQRLSIIYNNSYITHPLTGSSIIANLQVQPLQQPTYP